MVIRKYNSISKYIAKIKFVEECEYIDYRNRIVFKSPPHYLIDFCHTFLKPTLEFTDYDEMGILIIYKKPNLNIIP